MKKQILFLFLFLLVFYSFSNEKIQLKKWETYDIRIEVNDLKENRNPFQHELVYKITSPGGDSFQINGFYNGEKEFIVRFTPNEAGTWQAAPLNEISGRDYPKIQFDVTKNDESNHGSVVIKKDNPQKFYYEDGTAYNMLAFELDWLFALDYGDPDLPKAEQLLQTVKENGFNKVIMNVYAFDRRNKVENVRKGYDYGSLLEIYPFKGTNENPDYSSLNISFFKHLDNIIQLLNEKNIVAHLMIYVWNKKVNWPEPRSEADNMYFDYIVKRYQAYPNIIWDVSKEALSYGKDDVDYISERIERLRALDSYNRLLTVHDHGYCALNPDKVDFFSTQDWGTDLYNRMLNVRNKYPEMPVFNIEHGGYEHCQYDVFIGNYVDEKVCLRRNYECVFAGVYSTYYWQCTSWNVIIHNPFDENIDPQPRFDYYKYLSEFLNRFSYDQLEPVSGVSASGFALKNRNDYQYFFYVPEENSAIDIKNLPKTDKLELIWFDTYNGTYSKGEVKEWSNYFRVQPAYSESATILIIRSEQN